MHSCGSHRGFEPVVFGAHGVAAIDLLEPAHGEMTARDVLEMLDKGEIDGGSAQSAEDCDGLCGKLLRYDDAKARRYLCQKPYKQRRTFAERALVDRETGDFDKAAREHCTNCEIIGVDAFRVSHRAAERKDFEAGECGPRVGEVLAFLPRDCCDRA